jgi:hypothetical protein
MAWWISGVNSEGEWGFGVVTRRLSPKAYGGLRQSEVDMGRLPDNPTPVKPSVMPDLIWHPEFNQHEPRIESGVTNFLNRPSQASHPSTARCLYP